MQTIWKYGLGRNNNTPVEVSMPMDAIIQSAGYDPATQEFCVWAIVMTEYRAYEDRRFYIAGTGSNLAHKLKGDEIMDSLGSFMVAPSREPDRPVGWFHAFEVRSADPA